MNIPGTAKLNKLKTMIGPAESTDLISQNPKRTPISGETVPLLQFLFLRKIAKGCSLACLLGDLHVNFTRGNQYCPATTTE
jgi:hypothetical protein